MRGVLVVQLSLACGLALVGGCGGTATSDGQSGGTAGDASRAGGTDGIGLAGTGDGIAGSATSGTGDSAGGTGGDECVDGTERCPCYGNGTCNEGLICASDLCVDLGSGGQTGAGGSGGVVGAGGSSAAPGAAGAGGMMPGDGGAFPAGAGGTGIGGGQGLSGGAGDGGSTGSAGGGAGSTSGPAPLPCDVFQSAGHPCVSAHSTVRVLRSAYEGPLYQVCRGTSVAGPSSCQGETLDIGAVEGGYADAALQDEFCAGAQCTITVLYDQSGQGNHLEPSPPGGAKPTPANPVNAADLPVTINGHAVYGMLFRPGMGYRTGCDGCNIPTGLGTAVGDEPESMYMVTSQHDLINGCCFDYGNAETSCNDDGNGTAEAVYFGMGVIWGTGSGEGPWVMADLENGLYAGWENGQDQDISTNTPLRHDFVTAAVVGDTADKNGGAGRFALYGGDATTGTLTVMYDGVRPEKPGYVPMQKQGSVVLSIAGDNSDGDGGRFYEGVMVTGAASKQTVDALQAAIVTARYGSTDAAGHSGGVGGDTGMGGSTAVGGDSGAGGTPSGSAGGSATCTNVTPCGGDLVGTWTVTSSCLTVSGELDLSGFGLGCSSAPVAGSLQVTGTWTANADGTYSDNTTTTGEERIDLPASCLNVSGTTTTCNRIGGPLASLGYASVTCADNAATGGCTCPATVDQTGGIGLAPMYASANGTYTTAGNTLTISAGEQEYSYCVSGAALTMTPQSAPRTGTLTGTVELQQQ